MKRLLLRRSLFLFLGGILMFIIVFFSSRSTIQKSNRAIEDFDLSLKGILLDKKGIDRNDAIVKLLVLSTNYSNYRGEDWIGRKIEIRNDTAFLTLMRDSCLEIGDTISFGPKYNYQIKRGFNIIYDKQNHIDDCH